MPRRAASSAIAAVLGLLLFALGAAPSVAATGVQALAAAPAQMGGDLPGRVEIGAGESVTVPVVVNNPFTTAQTGTVSIEVSDGFSLDRDEVGFADLPVGGTTVAEFVLTHGDVTALAATGSMLVTTRFSTAGTSLTQDISLTLVPTTVVPRLPEPPSIDALAEEAYGPPISLADRWLGEQCEPEGVDCGPGGYSRLGWHGDELYLFIHVVDDAAGPPSRSGRCDDRRLADFVVVLLDPRGGSRDTSATFEAAVVALSHDHRSRRAGAGVCVSRLSHAHTSLVDVAPVWKPRGGPGVRRLAVARNVRVEADGSYAGGGWDVEMRIALVKLPSAVGPTGTAPTGVQATNQIDAPHLGLNVTPYDSDGEVPRARTSTAWSAHPDQRFQPQLWGHAYLAGYTPPRWIRDGRRRRGGRVHGSYAGTRGRRRRQVRGTRNRPTRPPRGMCGELSHRKSDLFQRPRALALRQRGQRPSRPTVCGT